jgi:hypothetical protein
VGGRVLSRPPGTNVLFALQYIWDMAGSVSEFPEPITIRLNANMAVTETFDFKFPAPEPVQAELPKMPGDPEEDEIEDIDVEEPEDVDVDELEDVDDGLYDALEPEIR